MNALSMVQANPISRGVLWLVEFFRHLSVLYRERRYERVAYDQEGSVPDDDRARAFLALVHCRLSACAGEEQCSDLASLGKLVEVSPPLLVEALCTALSRWNLSDGPRLQVITLLCAHYARSNEPMLIRSLLVAQRSGAGSILALELNRLARQYRIGEL